MSQYRGPYVHQTQQYSVASAPTSFYPPGTNPDYSSSYGKRLFNAVTHSTSVLRSSLLNRTNQRRSTLFLFYIYFVFMYFFLFIFLPCLTVAGSLAPSCAVKIFSIFCHSRSTLSSILSRLSALGGVQRPLWERGRGGGVGGEARFERAAVSLITPFLSPPTATPVSVEHNAGLFGFYLFINFFK